MDLVVEHVSNVPPAPLPISLVADLVPTLGVRDVGPSPPMPILPSLAGEPVSASPLPSSPTLRTDYAWASDDGLSNLDDDSNIIGAIGSDADLDSTDEESDDSDDFWGNGENILDIIHSTNAHCVLCIWN